MKKHLHDPSITSGVTIYLTQIATSMAGIGGAISPRTRASDIQSQGITNPNQLH